MSQSSDSGDGDPALREIRLTENADGQWTARDFDIEVSAQGTTRDAALEALDRVVAVIRTGDGHAPTDEDRRDLGVDPDVARQQGDELPDVLQ